MSIFLRFSLLYLSKCLFCSLSLSSSLFKPSFISLVSHSKKSSENSLILPSKISISPTTIVPPPLTVCRMHVAAAHSHASVSTIYNYVLAACTLLASKQSKFLKFWLSKNGQKRSVTHTNPLTWPWPHPSIIITKNRFLTSESIFSISRHKKFWNWIFAPSALRDNSLNDSHLNDYFL